jgi:predicted membrane protein
MNIFVIVIIILLLVGGFIQALQFLLWVGAVLLVIAVIAWAIRSQSGRSR